MWEKIESFLKQAFSSHRDNIKSDLKAELAALAPAGNPDLQKQLTEAQSAIQERDNTIAGHAKVVYDLTAEKAELATKLQSSETQFSAAQLAAKTAVDSFKLELKADATVPEQIKALETAAATVLSRNSLESGELPGSASATQMKAKPVSRTQFDAMSHAERNSFMRAGGKISV